MKNNILEWALAWVLDKLKIQAVAVWIIAAVLMGISYAAGYFNEICSNCLPDWVADWQTRIGLIVGLLLQARTTKTLEARKLGKAQQ